MYKNNSPWSKTKIINNRVLDIMSKRYIFPDSFDEVYVIEQKYNMRPDLLSYDRYGTTKYWWVFAARNMNILKDPIRDFKTGIEIRLPNKNAIDTMS